MFRLMPALAMASTIAMYSRVDRVASSRCGHAFAEVIERDHHARPLDALGAFDRFLDRFASDEPAREPLRPHAVPRRECS